LLLIIKVCISYKNSLFIDENVKIQKEAEKIKVNTLDIIRNLHLLDLGIRGYAIVKSDQIKASYDTAWIRKEVVLNNLEKALVHQQFEMSHFYKMRDSVNAYFRLTEKMMNDLVAGDRLSFENTFKQDPGYQVWVDYKKFSREINSFEDAILEESKMKYERALKLDYLLLGFLLILIIPTLFYTAFQTTKTMSALQQLKELETEKNRIFEEQNETLERLVKERTEKIETQNEEIKSQYEEISAHNEALANQQEEITKRNIQLAEQNNELTNAKRLIEDQHETIQASNLRLSKEVERQTKSLVKNNKDLEQHVSQLEQFAFIVSHNLRAPVARILGLGDVIETTHDQKEIKKLASHLAQSAKELDNTFHDLNFILQIKESGNESFQPVDLLANLQRIKNTLQQEIKNRNVIIVDNGVSANQINTIPVYMESILLNLISNAIKYSSDTRQPVIDIATNYDGDHLVITIKDNGSGIDLEKHQNNLFKPYKRFHKKGEGKGLGLFLVKTQVNLLGGEIILTSKPGEGTLFTIRLKHNMPAA
jgi:signal transduction histidine kinase